MRRRLRLPIVLVALAGPAVPLACGSRTGLLTPTDASMPAADQSAADSTAEADVTEEPDALADVLDAPDVPDVRDVVIPDAPDLCPDAGSTLIYVITQSNDLFSFYPPTLTFSRIGPLACPSAAGITPFSMAVDRAGIGHSVFSDGTLYVVDMATAACAGTTFKPGQLAFNTFCMGYAADDAAGGDGGESLYVAECNVTGMPRPNSKGLATLDTTSLTLRFVAPLTPPIPGPELTGTGDGRLFGFYTNAVGTGSHIVQIDRATGQLLQNYPLQVGTPQDGFAFAFWGGVFWVFTFSGANPATVVTRFDPVSRTETMVTTMSEGVVGAGVSTCAPM